METYPRIDITAWTQVGEGGNGKTYENRDNPDILLKVNRDTMNDEATVRRELEFSQHVAALGLPTPRMYDMVLVGDNYGQTFERIKGKRSLSRICADFPQRLGEAAALLANEGRKLHATQCDTSFFPSVKQRALTALETNDFVSVDDKQKLRTLIEGVADETTCVHGDFHSGNLIVSGDNRPYWIDLGWFGHGSYMFDLGHLYLLCNIYSQFEGMRNIFHMTREQLLAFWDEFAKTYTGQADHSELDAVAARFAPVDVVILSYLNPRPQAVPVFAHVIHTMVEQHY